MVETLARFSAAASRQLLALVTISLLIASTSFGCGSDGDDDNPSDVDAGGAVDDSDGGAGVDDSDGGVATVDAGPPPAPPDRLWVVPWEADICPGQRLQLSATGIYEGEDEETHLDLTAFVTWTSGDGEVVTVDAGGQVTGVASGGAVITATYGEVFDSADLTIVADEVAGLIIAPPTAAVAAGRDQIFAAKLVTTCGNFASDVTASATWGSTVPSVATLVEPGHFETALQGSATITASAEGFSNTAAIAVSAAVPVSLSIDPSLLTIGPEETVTLSATVTLTDDQTVDVTADATWTSALPYIVEVVSPGEITGVSSGGTEVKASYTAGGVTVWGVCGTTVAVE